MYTGSCLCGTVRYEVDGPFAMMANCHCSMCRKHHGAMFSTFASAPDTGFRWVSGQDNIETYPSSEQGRRPFCRTCGSVTPMLLPAMNLVVVPAGNLQDDPGLKPQMHIFTGSRAAWYPITDGLPQHEGYPPQFGGGAGLDRPKPQPSHRAVAFAAPSPGNSLAHPSVCRTAIARVAGARAAPRTRPTRSTCASSFHGCKVRVRYRVMRCPARNTSARISADAAVVPCRASSRRPAVPSCPAAGSTPTRA